MFVASLFIETKKVLLNRTILKAKFDLSLSLRNLKKSYENIFICTFFLGFVYRYPGVIVGTKQ